MIDLARRGMDIARINCAHDDNVGVAGDGAHVRTAGTIVGRGLTVLMDIAGPKIRTEAVVTPDGKRKLQTGDAVRLVASGPPRATPDAPFSAAVSLPEMVNRLTVGDRLRYDDSKLEGVVESVRAGEAIVRVTRTKAGGIKFKPEKGLNLPDTVLGLSPLTAKDERDLATVIECADMHRLLLRQPAGGHRSAGGGARSAPARATARWAWSPRSSARRRSRTCQTLIACASGRRPFGVMIARGDLAAEIGFERLAEMQEEILWICEAARVPAIWATQVLEDLVHDGVPSRGEMTDAAMAGRAECVMLNKGPSVGAGIELLDRLLARMDAHAFKKTPTLRALKSW